MANRTGKPRDLSKIGAKHGRLLIVDPVRKDGLPAWLCTCDCGNQHIVKNADLKNTRSCGCYRRERARDASTSHGMTKSKAYQAWRKMIARCTKPSDQSYKNYGGRGISVCERWMKSFDDFLSDMGVPGDSLSIDRINNDGNYEPLNCRWTNNQVQANNRRTNVVLNGLTLSQAARLSGHSVQVLSWRIYKMGMSIQDAMQTPKIRNRKPREILGGLAGF